MTKILGRRIFDLNRARPLGSAASHPRDLSGNESDFGVPVIPANERHDTIVETAERWGISVDLARDTFRDEPGVLKFVRPGTRVKRSYCTLRVPESVLARVYARLTS